MMTATFWGDACEGVEAGRRDVLRGALVKGFKLLSIQREANLRQRKDGLKWGPVWSLTRVLLAPWLWPAGAGVAAKP